MAVHGELLRKVRKIMMDDRLMFVYRGPVTGQNSVSLLFLLEKDMLNSDFGLTGRKRLFMFVLESLQNVSRHTDTPGYSRMSLVIYSKNGSGYTVTTGNVIRNEEEPGLREQLTLLNRLDKDEIRALYREKLLNNTLSDKGGAGLGLIEMARKTGNRLDFDFLRISDEYQYFVLSKSVDASGLSMNTGRQRSIFKADNIIRLERMMDEENIATVWSGHLTTDIEKQVLSFTETRMHEEDYEMKVRRKVFSIMVECLQNISKYKPGPEVEEELGRPTAMIVAEGNVLKITAGNIIRNSRVDTLRDKIRTVNRFDKNGLKELYRISLADDEMEAERTGILGLIDIARKSGRKLEYDFEEVDKNYSYCSLTVIVDINTI